MIDIVREQVEGPALALLRFVFKVQDDHESGDWDDDRVYCKACGPPTEYPCEFRRWAEKAESTAPPHLMKRWRETSP